MRNSAEVAKEVIWFLTPLPQEGKGSEISFPCMIAQHKIRLKRETGLPWQDQNIGAVPLH